MAAQSLKAVVRWGGFAHDLLGPAAEPLLAPQKGRSVSGDHWAVSEPNAALRGSKALSRHVRMNALPCPVSDFLT